jgi:bacillithiol system protein YtxJ
MDWIQLKEESAISSIKSKSAERPVVIFKHSTRCSISAATLSRLERNWNKQEMTDVKFYFLDLISNRPMSQKIEEVFGIPHESPQILIIYNGVCIYYNSHMGINYHDIKAQIGKIPVKS